MKWKKDNRLPNTKVVRGMGDHSPAEDDDDDDEGDDDDTLSPPSSNGMPSSCNGIMTSSDSILLSDCQRFNSDVACAPSSHIKNMEVPTLMT